MYFFNFGQKYVIAYPHSYPKSPKPSPNSKNSNFGTKNVLGQRIMLSQQGFVVTETCFLKVLGSIHNVNLFERAKLCRPHNCPKGLLCRDLSKFVVRPSSVVRPSRLSHSVLDRDFAKDACQELDSRSKPGPFGTFCKTSPYGRQSGCRT